MSRLLLEAGYSAQSAPAHGVLVAELTTAWRRLPLSAEIGEVAVDLQRELFAVGQGRSAGAVDLLHAATAIVHGAVVVHYDRDYERLARIDHRLRHRWVVPRGSVD